MHDRLIVFDRAQQRRRLVRAATLGPATFLLDRVAMEAAERLALVTRQFPLGVDLGTPGPAIRLALATIPTIGTVVASGPTSTHVGGSPGPAVINDEEA